jgi:hypothetical protein
MFCFASRGKNQAAENFGYPPCCIYTLYQCVGATKPAESAPGTIRGDFCIDVGRNVIHGSDSVESAQKELALWFPEGVVALLLCRMLLHDPSRTQYETFAFPKKVKLLSSA